MNEEKAYKGHVMVLAFPLQSHINPMLQFSKRLASKGIKITLTTTLSYAKKMQRVSSSMSFEHIYDDTEPPEELQEFLERFEADGSLNLTQLIRKLEISDFPVKCLVYDANLSWASTVVKRLRMPLLSAAFFTQSCTAVARYYPVYCEYVRKPLSLPPFPITGLPEPRLPGAQYDPVSGSLPPIIRYMLLHFNDIINADWVLFNSFDKLEEEVVKWIASVYPVRTIGPIVPSVYLDKRIESDAGYNLSLYDQNTDACSNWLNGKGTGSVVYVSFGSASKVRPEQFAELATALKNLHNGTDTFFLWVVKQDEQHQLPVGFVEETSETGLIVSWCSQLEVLAHPAVGCFVSHCGWNSTLEAISLGVPMVAMPQFLDQITNAHLVEHVWGVGVQTRVDEENLATAEEIGRCIHRVIRGETGKNMKQNAIRWKDLAKEAIEGGGSSDKYIEEIAAKIVHVGLNSHNFRVTNDLMGNGKLSFG